MGPKGCPSTVRDERFYIIMFSLYQSSFMKPCHQLGENWSLVHFILLNFSLAQYYIRGHRVYSPYASDIPIFKHFFLFSVHADFDFFAVFLILMRLLWFGWILRCHDVLEIHLHVWCSILKQVTNPYRRNHFWQFAGNASVFLKWLIDGLLFLKLAFF